MKIIHPCTNADDSFFSETIKEGKKKHNATHTKNPQKSNELDEGTIDRMESFNLNRKKRAKYVAV